MDESRRPRTAQEHSPTVTVVLVHGLWMRGVSMAALGRRLERRGMSVHVFDYPSVKASLDANATALGACLERLPGERIHLVGHSLGGVVIRALLERGIPARLGRIVCLGAPLRGSRTAVRTARLPGGRWLVGRSMLDLAARGGFEDWAGAPEVGSIAGGFPFGMGLFVGRFREPSDGTVAVAETVLLGERDHVVVPVSHVALLWSRRVSAQLEAFLIAGAFVH